MPQSVINTQSVYIIQRIETTNFEGVLSNAIFKKVSTFLDYH
jgi:hypothetical protein